MSNDEFPLPSSEELIRSQRLINVILARMAANGGQISFAKYMEMALYEPKLGYYTSDSQKFGPGGDYTTAPETSPLFAACLAVYCHLVIEEWDAYDIVEFGAGSGQLAIDLLPRLDPLPSHYYIIELSAELRERQQKRVRENLGSLAERVVWLDRKPEESLQAVVIANDVLDAMSVERFRWNKGEIQQAVICDTWEEAWILATNPDLIAAVQHLGLSDDLDQYTSEVNLWIKPWLSLISTWLKRGEILLIDYGFLRDEYYQPQRNMGTLTCFYRHNQHDDRLFQPGLQDMTAYVDFTAVMEAAQVLGLSVAGYSTQAEFLLEHGMIDMIVERQDLKGVLAHTIGYCQN